MLVKNATTSVISIPKTNEEDGNPGRLLPGVNEVPDRVWQVVAPSMQLHVDAGHLELLELPAGAKSEGAPEVFPISGVAQKDAIKLIAETTDAQLLERWEAEESAGNKRAKVLAAIKKQVAELALPPPSVTEGATKPDADEGEELEPES